MRYLKADKFYCFSPLVMLVTLVIEVVLAVYVFWRYAASPVTCLVIATLLGLAVFQMAEYGVCEGLWGLSSLAWAKVGYGAITLLPPLGLHLAVKLAGDSRPALTTAGYVVATVFVAFFLFVQNGVAAGACLGNYVIFEHTPGTSIYFAMYYYGMLMLTVSYAIFMSNKLKQPHRVQALRSLAVGYLAFMVPTTTANIIDPSTIAGIPSIMCGFAVLLAVMLAGKVLPDYYRQPYFTSKVKELFATNK